MPFVSMIYFDVFGGLAGKPETATANFADDWPLMAVHMTGKGFFAPERLTTILARTLEITLVFGHVEPEIKGVKEHFLAD